MLSKSTCDRILLASLLIASTALAQAQLSGTMGYSIPKSDPKIFYDGSYVGVSSGTSSGTDAHSISARWEASLRCSGSTLPRSVVIAYDLSNYAKGTVSLAGMNPPSGGARGKGSVANTLADTGTIGRAITPVNSSATAGPLTQNKSVTASVGMWTWIGEDLYAATVILETAGQTTYAHVDPRGGPMALKPAAPSPYCGTTAKRRRLFLPPESATGTTKQSGIVISVN